MSNPLQRYIGTADPLARLRDHAERLLRLDTAVQRALPEHLRDSCHVANIRHDVLVIHTASGAVAAKLRQLAPGILRALHGEGMLLSELRVRVAMPAHRPEPPPPVQRHVSAPSFDAMNQLAETLPENSPLRTALDRFVRQSRGN